MSLSPLSSLLSSAHVLSRLLNACRSHVTRASARNGKAAFRLVRRTLCVVLTLAGMAALPAPAVAALNDFGSKSVGHPTAVHNVTLTAKGTGTVASIRVATAGAVNLDFTDQGTGTCQTGASLVPNNLCTVDVVFKPTVPGVRYGAVQLLDSANNVLAVAYLYGVGTGPLATVSPGLVTTAAGSGDWIYRSGGDGIPATSAQVFLPNGIAMDATGNLYISDSGNGRIRKVDTSGIITTYAGLQAGSEPAVVNPSGLAVDGAGNLYIADSGNNLIRRVDALTGVMKTVVGSVSGNNSTPPANNGDGGDARSATLLNPNGVAFDPAGNMYIADSGNNLIRRVDAATNIITTVVGTGVAGGLGDGGDPLSAQLSSPWSVSFDKSGVMYIADRGNHVIRQILNGAINTVAGTNGSRGFAGDNGPAISSQLNGPASVIFDPAGNMYIADAGNNRVRRVNANTQVITTICGNDGESFDGDTFDTDAASLYGPYALVMDKIGNILVADLFHNRVRVINATLTWLHYPVMRVGNTSDPIVVTVQNIGTEDLSSGSIQYNQSQLDPATTTCGPNVVSSNQTCTLGVQFMPTTVGTTVWGSLIGNSNATNSPLNILPYGQVLSVEPTTVAVTADHNPGGLGQGITFTAVVTSRDTGRTGTVTFSDGTTALGTVNLNAAGSASVTVSTLTLGAHTINAHYSGNYNNAPSDGSLNESIVQPTQLTLVPSANPSTVLSSVTFTATLTATSPINTGSITFLDNGVAMGSAQLGAGGKATFATAGLSAGTHAITASFAGDTLNLASQSDALSQVVNRITPVVLLSADPSTVVLNNAVTLRTTLSSASGPLPTGNVTVRMGQQVLGTATVDNTGVATMSVSTLPVGVNTLIATYNGDTYNQTLASVATNVTVQPLVTATVLTSSATPASAGSVLNLTATVAMIGGETANGTMAGTVYFYEGATALGFATLDPATGKAVFATAGLTVGDHTLKAVYNGQDNYAGSTSAPMLQTVQSGTTTTALTVSPAASIAGNNVTLTATVSTIGTIHPTGNVTFSDENGTLGSVAVGNTLQAQLQLTTLPVGAHSIVATYVGDATYSSSSSAASPQAVRLGATTLALQSSAHEITVADNLNLTTTLSSDGNLPRNVTVTVRDGSTPMGTLTLNSQGVATLATTSLAVGTHTLIASYVGDSANAAIDSAAVTVVVDAATTRTTLTTSQSPSIYPNNVTLTATVASSVPGFTGNVTFMEGGTVLGTGTLNGSGMATMQTASLTIGTHNVQAVYAGDGRHLTSTSAILPQQVLASTGVVMKSGTNPAYAGLPVVFSVQVTGSTANGASATPSGTVTLRDGGVGIATTTLDGNGTASFTLATLKAGTHNLIASYGGDPVNQAADSLAVVQTIQNGTTQAVLTVAPGVSAYGAPVTFTASVTSTGAGPTGNVNFTDGTNLLGQAALKGGVATFTTSTLLPGMHSVTAVYAGDANNGNAGSPAVSEQVLQNSSVVLSSNSNPGLTLANLTLTAAVHNVAGAAPTGTVTFQEGSAVLGTATVNNGVATLQTQPFSAGNHTLTATYGGDVADNPSSTTLAQVINLRSTTATVSSTAASATTGGIFSVIGVVHWDGPATPSGTVTFNMGGQVIGSASVNNSGIATLSVASNAITGTVTATYGGDGAYSGSTSSATDVSNGAATNFTIALDPTTMSVQTSRYVVAHITLASHSGFSDTIALGCLGLPYAATCTFDKDQIKLAANGTAQVQVTVDTGSPLTGGGQGMASLNLGRREATLAALPAGALLALLLFGRRRRALPVLLLLLLAALVGPTIGCGSISQKSTSVGTYKFQVTGSGLGTGVALSQDVTLTVTQ